MHRRRLLRRWLPVVAAVLALTPRPSQGHAFAPALLELVERADGTTVVRWKQPAARAAGSGLAPRLPDECQATTEATARTEGSGLVLEWTVRCPGGWEGREVSVDGILASRADVLLRVEPLDGGTVHRVLTGDAPSFRVPSTPGTLDVVVGYGRLGVEHIAAGVDHLLFVLALVLMVRDRGRLLWTVTSFTFGHSITLALATLGVVSVPQAPVEASIALSIYLLAIDLARSDDAPPSRLRRGSSWVAASFGLLHGLGFAGALTELGLPPADVPAALLAFNCGIEIGQIAFIVAVLAAWSVVRRLPWSWPTAAARLPAYAIGSIAAFWFFERLWAQL